MAATPDRSELPTAGTWNIDPSHSSVEAVARHLVVSKVRGRFGSFSGTVEIGENIVDSKVEVTIDAKTIDTGDEGRDEHLRSGDFLDVDNHGQITFVSTSVEHDKGSQYKIPGDLTIRGVTKPVVLDAEFLGLAPDPWGNTRAAFSASTEIDRESFDITWNQALETGGVLVSKKLTVDLDIQLVPAS